MNTEYRRLVIITSMYQNIAGTVNTAKGLKLHADPEERGVNSISFGQFTSHTEDYTGAMNPPPPRDEG